MIHHYILVFTFFITYNLTSGQLEIYSDTNTEITGTWTGNASILETSSSDPYEGNLHYEVIYSYNANWAGVGLNFDNWGAGTPLDLSAYSHIRIAYKGLNNDVTLNIQLRQGTIFGNNIQVGNESFEYVVIDIPMVSLTAGTSIDLSQITEIDISTSSVTASNSGVVYFDNIIAFNKSSDSFTSQATWSRFQNMDKGFNFSNWLEAYWLIPFNTYPEADKFTRSSVENLVNLGFNSARLPVTFERIGDENFPYTLDTNHPSFSLIDSAILWAADYDLNLIITNHHGIEITDANYTTELPRIRAVWSQILAKYGSLDPSQYFFELYNEPTFSISNSNFRTVIDSLILDIRSTGYNHSIIIGGNAYNSASALLGIQPYSDPDIIYTFHSYNPYAFTHQQMSWTSPPYLPEIGFPANSTDSINLVNEIKSTKEWSQFYKVPVMIGEFGVSNAAPTISRCNYINTIGGVLYSNDIPWYYWDATSSTDAFGFINESNIPTDCFAQSLHLSSYNTCELLVTNANTNGSGSLKSQLSCAAEGDTIWIDAIIGGENILLETPSIFINKNLTIIQQGGTPSGLTMIDDVPLLEVANNKELSLDNIHLIQSNSSTSEMINVKGKLVLKNIELTKQ